MEYLSVLAFSLLFALFLFYPKYAFAAKFLTHFALLTTGKLRKLSGKRKMLCAIPFLNNSFLHRVMGQKIHAMVDKVIGIVFCFVFLFTTVEQFFLTVNPWIILISWIALLLVYAAAWLNDAILAFKMAVLLERGHVAILCVLPPLCYFLLVNSVKPYFRKNRDELSGAFDTQYL